MIILAKNLVGEVVESLVVVSNRDMLREYEDDGAADGRPVGDEHMHDGVKGEDQPVTQQRHVENWVIEHPCLAFLGVRRAGAHLPVAENRSGRRGAVRNRPSAWIETGQAIPRAVRGSIADERSGPARG